MGINMKDKELLISSTYFESINKDSTNFPSIYLTSHQQHNLELILNGGFHPLKGFLNSWDYECVLNDMRLENVTLWPLHITLDISESLAKSIGIEEVALRDEVGVLLGILNVDDIWEIDKKWEAEKIFGTSNLNHPQ